MITVVHVKLYTEFESEEDMRANLEVALEDIDRVKKVDIEDWEEEEDIGYE